MQGPSFTTQDIGLLERLIRVFHTPRTSFAAVYQRETTGDWLVPVLLACLVGIACYYIVLPITLDPDSPEVQQQLQDKTEEEQEHYLQSMWKYGWMMVPVGAFSSLVIVGGVLLLLTRPLFNQEVTYQQMLIVKAYASVVLIPQWIVRTFLTILKKTDQVHTGLGAFVPEEMAGTFVGRVLISLDFFDAWQAYLLGLGIAAMARVSSTKRPLVAIFVLWGLWILAGAGAETFSANLPPPEPAPGG